MLGSHKRFSISPPFFTFTTHNKLFIPFYAYFYHLIIPCIKYPNNPTTPHETHFNFVSFLQFVSLASSPRSCTKPRTIFPLTPSSIVLSMILILVGCHFFLFRVIIINVTRKRPQCWKLWQARMFHWRFFWKVLLFGVRKTNFYKVFKNFNTRILISHPWPWTMRLFKSQSKVHNEYLLPHTFLFVGLCYNFIRLIHCFLWCVPE